VKQALVQDDVIKEMSSAPVKREQFSDSIKTHNQPGLSTGRPVREQQQQTITSFEPRLH
jgi:hypothetical protein